ncbi:hypothetical protein RB599_009434 [Gaeumannomyces hyphopodioides]
MASSSSKSTAFAADAVAEIRTQVQELSKQKGLKAWCLSLEGVLASAHKRLQASSAPADHQLQAVLPKLLRLLDGLVRWHWPGEKWPHPRGLEPGPYQGLQSLRKGGLDAKLAVKQSIRELSRPVNRKNQDRLYTALESVAQIEEPADPDLGDIKCNAESNDYQAHIKRLYSVLSQHCVCVQDKTMTRISANLRLNNDGRKVESGGDTAMFGLLVLGHPHQDQTPDACLNWKDIIIQLSRERRVRMADGGSNCSSRTEHLPSSLDFCGLISCRALGQLQLEVSNGFLVPRGAREPERVYVVRSPSLPLASVLSVSPPLTAKPRLRLCYELAKAVWEFYDSSWMEQVWTKEVVHFMFQRPLTKDADGIYVDDPLLLVRFAEKNPHSAGDRKALSHKFPKLLALGVMMMEVELGVRIEDFFDREWLDPLGVPLVNADHFAALKLFKDEERWSNQDTFDALKSAIEMCLKPAQWRTSEDDMVAHRDAVYQKVVAPLQLLWEGTYAKSPHVRGIRKEELKFTEASSKQLTQPEKGEGLSPGDPPLPAVIPSPGQLCTIPKNGCRREKVVERRSDLTAMPSESKFSSSKWFEHLRTFNETLRIKDENRDESTPPSRVAIIDTGVCPTLQDTDFVKEYRDFLDDKHSSCQDSKRGDDNHGTNACRLLKFVYAAAEVYVARVWDKGGEYTDDTPVRMAQAIDYAFATWGVGVIVIPSGFYQEHDCIRDAACRAGDKGALVFAAASNDGGLKPVTFPASLHSAGKLFCMFATTPGGRALVEFNPIAPDPRRPGNSFAAIGADICLPNVPGRLSGTSYSAVVAGAIAAQLLDFSRQKDVRDKIRNRSWLTRVEGMGAVLAALSSRSLDGGHRCLAPWQVLSDEDDEVPWADRIRSRREQLRETLSVALRGTYS